MKGLLRITVLFWALALVVPISIFAQEISIGNYTLIQGERVGLTIFEYTYAAAITNNDSKDLRGVIATLTVDSPATSVVEERLIFGDVPAGHTIDSFNTFTIQHDRLVPFNPDALEWDIRTAPTVTMTSPDNFTLFGNSPITVSGEAEDAVTIVVNGADATLTDGTWTAIVPIEEGTNTITAVAESEFGIVSTTSIEVTLDTAPPTVMILTPPNDFVTTSPVIAVTGLINDIVVGTVNGEQAQVTVNDVEAEISNRCFLATEVPLVAGENIITAIGTDRAGNTAETSIIVTLEDVLAENHIRLVSGNTQSGTVGEALPEALVVELVDGDGNPVPDKMVIFKITTNDGQLSDGVGFRRSLAVETDDQGQAAVNWTLGMRSGAGNNIVEATAVGFAGTAIFTATALPATPAKILVDAGNNQVGVANRPLTGPFVAVVADSGDNRLSGVPVTYTVIGGDGKLNSESTLAVNTDSDGRAVAFLTLGMTDGFDNNIVEANFAGNPSSRAVFVASGLIAGDPADTKISGVVLDNSDLPISGATVEIEGTNLTTQTDEQGQFLIESVPVGNAVLHIDGSTAAREGEWPALEFEFVTVAGRNNTLGRPIYLLPLDMENTLVVNDVDGGTLTLPKVPGFALTVAPGSTTFPGGGSSGQISVTPVNPDKVPMAPSFGLQPRFAITIQPAGTLFDPPAPIVLPNVGGLAPGEITEMYSFDHDIGQFVAIGTGTVSEDGTVVESDPGVGIVKGGWFQFLPPEPTGEAEKASVNIAPSSVHLQVDDTEDLTASGKPSPGSYSWTSSNPSVAQIEGGATGKNITIKALKVGEANLTVTYRASRGGTATDTATVQVGDIFIASLEPVGALSTSNSLVLGENMTINYGIPESSEFDSVEIQILNGTGTVVDQATGLPKTPGNHTFRWTGQWTQPPHAGAFANPKNGPYEIKIIGTQAGVMFEDVRSISTKLVIEADINDEIAHLDSPELASGFEDVADALKIVMRLEGTDVQVFSEDKIQVMGDSRHEKHIKVDDPGLNTLGDGSYTVEFRDLRDEIGNFADMGSADGIQPFEFDLELR